MKTKPNQVFYTYNNFSIERSIQRTNFQGRNQSVDLHHFIATTKALSLSLFHLAFSLFIFLHGLLICLWHHIVISSYLWFENATYEMAQCILFHLFTSASPECILISKRNSFPPRFFCSSWFVVANALNILKFISSAFVISCQMSNINHIACGNWGATVG